MAGEARVRLDDPGAIAALTHPVRWKLLNYLMSSGPATASQGAHAIGDTPSNCSYHLRTLAKYGWVEAEGSSDARERPWRALVTGFSLERPADPDSPLGRNAAALLAMTIQQDQQEVLDAAARFPSLDRPWQDATEHSTYTLRMTAAELADLTGRLDALIRPYIAATREERPDGSALVHLGLHAFPRKPDPAMPEQ
ncbi:MAG: winged helix-turn-helix domain-containing protein [Streptosporangiales bacterium]|nr:winged helix-turn-helix domain-containing protein [Streptosporangiales bacterium]